MNTLNFSYEVGLHQHVLGVAQVTHLSSTEEGMAVDMTSRSLSLVDESVRRREHFTVQHCCYNPAQQQLHYTS